MAPGDEMEMETDDGEEIGDLEVGDQVQHPKWGIGSVMFKSGTGNLAKVVVVFPEEGQKKLLVKKARLKKV